MDEAAWLASEDPAAMLRLVEQTSDEGQVIAIPRRPSYKVSERKLRLWASAACRQALRLTSSWVPASDSARLCDLSDRFADGEIGGDELAGFRPTHPDCSWPLRYLNTIHTTILNTINHAKFLPGQAALVREVVGNPFRPALPVDSGPGPYYDPAWLDDPAARSLARAAYESRLGDGTLDGARLLVLSDALEEAGCDRVPLLRHLRGYRPCYYCGDNPAIDRAADEWCTYCGHERWLNGDFGPGPHVRGCWALDLILGKS
jgi:hypothetical protein